MLIYFSMIIPVITAIVLYVYWHHKCLWWEFLIPFTLSLILCFTMKLTVEAVQTYDTEWWTGAVVATEYYEEWNERVSCRHPKHDKKGNITGYEHLYDVDYHPPYWQVIDSNGLTVTVDSNKFDELSYRFGRKRFVNLSRNYHSINGNKYVSKWDGSDEKCEVCTTQHHYSNRVIASSSVFKFPEPDTKEGLFEYPPVSGYYDSNFVLGWDDRAAERKLALWNAKNGKEKQCRLMFLVYKDLPFDVVLSQENYWQGGNKNEFIVAVGTSKEKVQWCYVISWTEEEALKARVKSFVLSQEKLDLGKLVEGVGIQVKDGFVRKRFKDFDYLTVEPPLWTVMLTFFLTAGVNIGLSVWIVRNEYEDSTYEPKISRRVFEWQKNRA